MAFRSLFLFILAGDHFPGGFRAFCVGLVRGGTREPESFLAKPFTKVYQGKHDWDFPEQSHRGAQGSDGSDPIQGNGRSNRDLEVAGRSNDNGNDCLAVPELEEFRDEEVNADHNNETKQKRHRDQGEKTWVGEDDTAIECKEHD